MASAARYGGLSAAIVDDHPIFRKGLAGVLKEEIGFGTVHEGASARAAIQIAGQFRPVIVFLDLHMPGDGMEALREIRALTPETHCVLLTACDGAEEAISGLNLGASGYILKGVGAIELAGAVEAILGGETFVSPSFATRLLRAAQGPADPKEESTRLTQREIDVLRELELGNTNREIALNLRISEKTVKFYMTNIMQKYGVKNRVAAVMAFQKEYPAESRAGAPARHP